MKRPLPGILLNLIEWNGFPLKVSVVVPCGKVDKPAIEIDSRVTGRRGLVGAGYSIFIVVLGVIQLINRNNGCH